MSATNPRMHGHQFGKELSEALGLDPHLVSEITIHTRATEAVTVEVLMHIGVDEAEKVYRVLARYELTERKEINRAALTDGPYVVNGR